MPRFTPGSRSPRSLPDFCRVGAALLGAFARFTFFPKIQLRTSAALEFIRSQMHRFDPDFFPLCTLSTTHRNIYHASPDFGNFSDQRRYCSNSWWTNDHHHEIHATCYNVTRSVKSRKNLHTKYELLQVPQNGFRLLLVQSPSLERIG